MEWATIYIYISPKERDDLNSRPKLMNYGWRFMILTGDRNQDHPQGKKKMQKPKWLSEEALQIAEERSETQRRKGKIYPSECRLPEKSKER